MVGFFIGLFVGGFIGVALMCCCNVASQADKNEERMLHNDSPTEDDKEENK